jgi:2-succinyl-5-enolpyruvyl-6-hydroxy-3-cyclohexene-1-carboxylate synthase
VTRVPPVTRPPTEEELGPLVEALEGARRGLLLAGPAPVAFGALRPAVQRLVARAGLVLAAESTSQLRHGPGSEAVPRLDGADAVFRSETGREWLAPDVILQLGAHPVATGTDRLLGACSSARRFVVAPHGWPDPAATAEVILRGEPAAVVEAVCDRLGGSDSDRTASYRAAAAAAQGCVWRQVDEMLSAAGEALTEGAIARAVVEAVPPEGLLSVGNSLPVRQLDAYVPSSERPLAVLCQRGASGIDGLVSSAAGAARGWSGPVVLYLGDVSFLHDVGGLLAARTVPRPFVVVAVHNDGGRIFEQLPVAQRADLSAAMAHFTTPHGLSLGAIAAAFGHRQRRVDSVPALRDALHDAVRRDGCTVIEAVVPPSGAYAQNSALWSGVERALATERARWNP